MTVKVEIISKLLGGKVHREYACRQVALNKIRLGEKDDKTKTGTN